MDGVKVEKAYKALEVSGLHVHVKSKQGMTPLVRNVHFEMERGSVLGLVGESGCGKSVTCNALLRLLDPRQTSIEGSVKLNGRELSGLHEEEMRQIRGKEIALIMQNPMSAFTPVYRIGDAFAETIRTHTRLTKKQALELAVSSMEAVSLPNPASLLNKYPFQLSGGMLQRVMIAICMSLRPAVVIADEPTTALDVVNQLGVLKELDRLRVEHGTAILLISHDLGVISELADEVAVMQHGEIVERADVFQLFDHPKHPYTQKLLHARPKLIRNEPKDNR
jgi:nickel transport system ATP-binding protein